MSKTVVITYFVAQPTALRCRDCQVVAEGGKSAVARVGPGGNA
jgi:hypothetical protein